MATFNSNVFFKQGMFTWRDFKLKPNDATFDSSQGLQDILESGKQIILPPGIFYANSLDAVDGSKLIGTGPWRKITTGTPDNSDTQTIIRYNGAGGTNTYLLKASTATLSELANETLTIDNRIDVFVNNITFDANGNSVASNGTRNSDGEATADFCMIAHRCGNNDAIIDRVSFIGAKKVGLVGIGLYSTGIYRTLFYENEDMSLDLGSNYFGWVNNTNSSDVICHELTFFKFDIRNNGDLEVGGGGGGTDWSADTTNYKRGAAHFQMGRNCVIVNGSYQVNGGPLIFAGQGRSSSIGSEFSKLDNVYFEKNYANITTGASLDDSYALMIPYSAEDIGRVVENCFFNPASSNRRQNILLKNIVYNGDYLPSSMPGNDDNHGADSGVGSWIKFNNCGSWSNAGGATVKLYSETRRFVANTEENGPSLTFSNKLPYNYTRNILDANKLYIPRSTQIVSVVNGIISVNSSHVVLDTDGGAATANVSIINGGTDGMILIVRQLSNNRDIFFKHNTAGGNVYSAQLASVGGSVNLTNVVNGAMYLFDSSIAAGGKWTPLSFWRGV